MRYYTDENSLKFKGEYKKVTTTYRENTVVSRKYFTKVFNREVEVDWNYTNKTEQKRIIIKLENLTSLDEFDNTINKVR